MLTKQDLHAIKLLIEVTMDEKLEEKLEEKLREHLGRYPTKDEFYTMMDKLMGELETIRNEQIIITHHHEEFRSRVKAQEDIHPNNQHQFSSPA